MSVEVEVRDAEVAVELSGIDAVYALRRHLRLPMSCITAAAVVPKAEARRSIGWRVGGTAFPGRVLAGWFVDRRRRGHRQWWSTYRDDEVLVIDTTLRHPSRVVLQHPDRHDLAWWIGERLGRRS